MSSTHRAFAHPFKRDSRAAEVIGIGAGGHARVMIQLARQCGYPISCLLEPASSGKTQRLLDGVMIEHADEETYFQNLVRRSQQRDATCSVRSRHPAAVLCIGTVGDTSRRTKVFQRLQSIGYSLPNLIAGSAIVEQHVQIATGVHVLPGALIAAGAVLGDNVLVNHRVIIEHDCVIGNHVHLASGSILCGGVVVEDGALLGAGSVVLPGLRIGAGAVIGGGATVTRDVPAGETHVGNPARALMLRRTAA